MPQNAALFVDGLGACVREWWSTPLSTMSRKPKRPGPAALAPAAPEPVTYSWTVLPVAWPQWGAGHKRKTVKVRLLCNQAVICEGSRWVFWRSCQDLAEQYNAKQVVPRVPPRRVLADYDSPKARTAAARRSDLRDGSADKPFTR